MNILALDCAGNACSVACAVEGRAVALEHREMRRGHAEHLVPMMADVLADAGMSAQSLDALAVTTGPGAFTGVRIGLAAVQGLALSSGLPVIGITCFDHILAASKTTHPTLVVLETKRADFYLQGFDADQHPIFPPLAGSFEDLQKAMTGKAIEFAIIGDGSERFEQEAKAVGLSFGTIVDHTPGERPNAAVLAEIAYQRSLTEPLPEIGDIPKPLYLRPPDVGPATKTEKA